MLWGSVVYCFLLNLRGSSVLCSDAGHGNKRRKVESQAATAAAIVEPGSYAAQLTAKASRVRELFADTHMPELEIFESIKEHYRLR